MTLRYTVILTPDTEGQLSATVPAMPNIFTWGVTPDEALASAREAIALYLEQYVERGKPFPRDRTVSQALKTVLARIDDAHVHTVEVEAPAQHRVAS
jgi:predicted RNase H-like HicB family nuclease